MEKHGEACYPMAEPPLEQFPGGPNLGAMGGEAQPTAHHAICAGEGCSVSAFLVGHFLVVSDITSAVGATCALTASTGASSPAETNGTA